VATICVASARRPICCAALAPPLALAIIDRAAPGHDRLGRRSLATMRCARSRADFWSAAFASPLALPIIIDRAVPRRERLAGRAGPWRRFASRPLAGRSVPPRGAAAGTARLGDDASCALSRRFLVRRVGIADRRSCRAAPRALGGPRGALATICIPSARRPICRAALASPLALPIIDRAGPGRRRGLAAMPWVSVEAGGASVSARPSPRRLARSLGATNVCLVASPIEAIDLLCYVAAGLRAGVLGDAGVRFAGGLEAYLKNAPVGLTLDRAMGVNVEPGGSPWWVELACKRRDDLLVEYARRFCLPATAAASLTDALRAYERRSWPRDRGSREMPPEYAGKHRELLYRAFRENESVAPGRMPTSHKQLRRILASNCGAKQNQGHEISPFRVPAAAATSASKPRGHDHVGSEENPKPVERRRRSGRR
jgi:hypothetical protein